VGCAGRMTSFTETGDGRYLITLTGIRRFELTNELASDTPYRQGVTDWTIFDIDAHKDPSGDAVDREMFLDIMRDYLEAEGLKADWDAALSAPIDTLVSSLAMGCPFAPNEKQALLEAKTIADRAECLMTLMEMSGAVDPDSGGQLQ
jgi:Lon protease-like protein